MELENCNLVTILVGFPGDPVVKNLPAKQMSVQALTGDDPQRRK